MRKLVALGILLLSACGTEPGVGDDDGTTAMYPEIPAEAQRAGDPAKGYDYLLNGGYVTCGLPKSIAPAGSTADRIPGRTGDNAALAYYYSAATSKEGVRVVSANCLMCHAGRINNQVVVGLGRTDVDFTKSNLTLVNAAGGLISNPTEKAEWQRFRDRVAAIDDWSKPLTVGVNPADSFTAVLMAHHDPQTLAWSDEPLVELPPKIVVPVDTPPWWRMNRKTAMFYTAAGRGDHARIMMAASLLCTDSVEEATAIDQAFIDVRAWIEEGLKAPAWPWSVDAALAAKGKPVFDANCARCHGTYGEGGKFTNQVVPIEDVGTDGMLASGETEFAGRYVEWFASSFWGQTSRMEPSNGYIAPPLDGVWATAPFFHNGSVPTLEGVIDSSRRPQYWTRTFDSNDYNQQTVGWNFTKLDHGQAAEPTLNARVKIYDTTLTGYGNGGHTFADDLSGDDKTALLEYLKTL